MGERQRVGARGIGLDQGRPVGRETLRVIGLKMLRADAPPVLGILDRPFDRLPMEIAALHQNFDRAIRITADDLRLVLLDDTRLAPPRHPHVDRRGPPAAVGALELQDAVDVAGEPRALRLPLAEHGVGAAEDLDERNPVHLAAGQGPHKSLTVCQHGDLGKMHSA